MNITTHRSTIHTIRPGDRHFQIQDKFTVSNRASIEIDEKCPSQYKQIIAECYRQGWLKPVANITERERLFMGLTDE